MNVHVKLVAKYIYAECSLALFLGEQMFSDSGLATASNAERPRRSSSIRLFAVSRENGFAVMELDGE